ncbi:hypothetical protein PIB30_099076, partial [Stylosanthes scabra]|nr:hypothetical protein [Stylosanthes scabra]
SEHLPKLRREMRLTQDLASKRDFVLEVAGPSDRLPFRALEDRTHFLWVYVELFTCLGIRLPFSNFQREVLTRCQVAASQLHLNGWGFLHTFECVCLHFGFRPSWRIFLYTYQLHAPPPGNGFLSFLAYQGRRLFDAFEESIQEFKECRITALDPLQTLAFDFLQSLPVGLGKKSNFRCRWILDHSDAEVGAFLDSLLTDIEKQSRFDRLKQKMAEVAELGPRSILPHVRTPPTTSGASASSQAVPAPAPVASTAPVPLPATTKKRGSSKDPAGKPFSVEGEEGAKEDPSADLKKKGRKRKAPEAEVSPINHAFPDDYNFRAILDAGLTNGPTREQLLGTAQHLACQLDHHLPSEKAFAAKVQMEKELVSLKDQVDVLTVERDSALAAHLLNAKIKSLTQELAVSEGKRLSALARMAEVEEKARVQAA